MRYLMIHKIDESRPEAWNPSQEFQDAMGALMSRVRRVGHPARRRGRDAEQGRRDPPQDRGRRHSVTDGPFSEAREVIGGFALVNVESKEQALELAGKFASLFDEVSVEVRRVYEFEDLPQPS